MIETSIEQKTTPKTRITFYISIEDAKRVRIAAITAGVSPSTFIAWAALCATEEVERQEAERTGGEA